MTTHWASNGGEQLALRAHQKSQQRPVPEGYKLTPGLRQAMHLPMEHQQAAHKFPWAIIVPFGGGKRKQLRFSFLSEAIHAHSDLIEKYPAATIVSRNRGYDIPTHYRGRLPRPWKWCPWCMKPRKYKPLLTPTGERQTFYHIVGGGERHLLLMASPVCGQNNRHYMFRRSNQPWRLTKVPKGRKRLKRKQ